jgi:hypothetical protein
MILHKKKYSKRIVWSGPLHKIRMIKLNKIFNPSIINKGRIPKTIPTTYENI